MTKGFVKVAFAVGLGVAVSAPRVGGAETLEERALQELHSSARSLPYRHAIEPIAPPPSVALALRSHPPSAVQSQWRTIIEARLTSLEISGVATTDEGSGLLLSEPLTLPGLSVSFDRHVAGVWGLSLRTGLSTVGDHRAGVYPDGRAVARVRQRVHEIRAEAALTLRLLTSWTAELGIAWRELRVSRSSPIGTENFSESVPDWMPAIGIAFAPQDRWRVAFDWNPTTTTRDKNSLTASSRVGLRLGVAL